MPGTFARSSALMLLVVFATASFAYEINPADKAEAWRGKRYQQQATYTDNGAGEPALLASWSADSRRLLEVVYPDRPAVGDWRPGQPGAEASLWVRDRPAGKVRKVAIRLIDDSGESFQWTTAMESVDGWQKLTWPLQESKAERIGGGDKNRAFNGAGKLFGILAITHEEPSAPVHLWISSHEGGDVSAEAAASLPPTSTIAPATTAGRIRPVQLDLVRTANLPIFPPDGSRPIELTVRNPGGFATTFDLDVEFEAYDGTTSRWSKPGVSVEPGQTTTVPVDIELERVGWYAVRPTLRADDASVEKPMMSLLYIEPAGARTHPPEEGFWLGIDARIRDMQRDAWKAEASAMIGADHLRVGNTWPHIQPDAADELVWDKHDATLQLLDAFGLKAVYGLTFTPRWAVREGADEDLARRQRERGLRFEPRGHTRMPPDPQAWSDFVAAVAAYNNGRNVIAYEVWNEPDLAGFYHGSTDQFLELMRIAYEQVERHHPEATVLGAGIATVGGHGGHNLNPDLIDRSILEAYDYYEALALHQHGTWNNFVTGIDGRFAALRAQLPADKPVFFTETGSGSGGELGSDRRRKQAKSLPKKVAFARSRGAMGINWFALQFSDEFGMMTRGPRPMPYAQTAVFNQLAKMMRGRDFVAQHDLGTDAWVLEFAGPDDRLAVAWAVEEAVGQQVAFAAPAGSTVIDIMGNVEPLASRDGLAVIELTDEAQYVLLPDGGRVTGGLASLGVSPVGVPGQTVEVSAFLNNPIEAPLTYELTWRPPNGPAQTDRVAVEPGPEPREVTYALTMPAAPAAGEDTPRISLAYAVEGQAIEGELSVPIGVAQLIPADSMSARRPDFVLDTLNDTIVNVNQADPNRAAYVWTGPEDLSVEAWLALDGDALVLRAAVRDDMHRQTNRPRLMWRSDSLQIGMLLPDQPEQWEFGVGLGADGPAATTYIAAITSDLPASDAFDLDIEPIGGGLIYNITMPLVALGVDRETLRTRGMGFSLVVNDEDDGGREGWAQASDGIARSKDASLFPLVIFE